MNKRSKISMYVMVLSIVAITFNLLTIITFYDGLRNAMAGYGYISIVNMNSVNEFWFEFALIHVLMILVIVSFFKGLSQIFRISE